MTDKNRRRTRIHGHFSGTLSSRSLSIPIATLNLSLKGILCLAELEDEPALVRGDECKVTLPLSGDITLELEGVVARIHGHELGVDFTAMDEESYTHLRNIIRFSAEDPDAIDQEQVEKPFA